MRLLALVGVLALVACTSRPAEPPPGRSTAWGYLKLVPNGALESSWGASAYGDRRLRDARRVDYSQPGFAVAYVDGPAGPASTGAPLELSIRGGQIHPERAVVLARQGISIRNDGEVARVVSCPRAGWIRRLAPGETVDLDLTDPGDHPLFLLDGASEGARIFVSPGPFAVVADSGRFELSDLAPGRRQLHAWHPRFPPAARWIELVPGGVLRVDMELGVGVAGIADAD